MALADFSDAIYSLVPTAGAGGGNVAPPNVSATMSSKASATWVCVVTPHSLHDGLIAEAGASTNGWALSVRSDGTIEAANNSGGISLSGGSYSAGEQFFVAAVYEKDGIAKLWKNGTLIDSGTPTAGQDATGINVGAFLAVASSVSGSVTTPFRGVGDHIAGFDFVLSDAQVANLWAEFSGSGVAYDRLGGGLLTDPLGGGLVL